MRIIVLILMMITACEQTREFKSQRINKSASILLTGTPSDVFPLFGPIREKEWAHGWDPEIVFTEDKVVEEHMIFRTKPNPHRQEYYTWVVTQFDPKAYRIEYTVSTEERIWFVRVTCDEDEGKTKAIITYTYTSLTESGRSKNEEALKGIFAHDLKDWEEAINHYLSTGEQLRPSH